MIAQHESDALTRTDGANFSRFQDSLPRSFRQRVNDRMITHSARNPKPEVMFADMIKAGELKIVRRRFKAPLLVRIKQKRKLVGA
jgi:hypothetical protein